MSLPSLYRNAVTRIRETNLDLLEYAKTNRNEGIFNDITLQVDNISIGANRMVLACCSIFFESMFKSRFKERYESSIQVTGVDGKTTDTLVNYMYDGQITIENNSVMDILAGADYFQMNEVKQYCFEYLSNQLTRKNWYAVHTAAKLYRSDQLQKHVNEFITDHFDEVVENSDFKTFSKDDLTTFISNLNRNRMNESLIYKAIINWIKHNEKVRMKEFPDLFHLIKLNKLSCNALQDISSETLVQNNLTCGNLVLLALVSKLKKETKMMENESKIVMIGGDENSEEVMEIFNCNCVEPKSYPNLPYSVKDHRLLKLNDEVFCIGGRSTDGTEVYNKVCQMKSNLKWSDAAPMNEKRCYVGSAVFCDYFVVAGGWDGKNRLASIEYFNCSSGKWQMGPSMQRKRSNFCFVKCDGSLFAFGGWGEKGCLSCGERLRSLNSEWEFIAPMSTKRVAVAGASLNGYIYAIGGNSGKGGKARQETVEKYNPKLNKWNYVCEMNYVRSRACACVLNGRIFVAGGVDDEGELVREIECYNPSEDKWEIVQFSWKDKIRDHSAIIAI